MRSKAHEGPGIKPDTEWPYCDSYRMTVVAVVLHHPPVPGKKRMFYLCENTRSATNCSQETTSPPSQLVSKSIYTQGTW